MSRKRKLTPAEKRAKAERREKFMTVFIGGKQKWVRRSPTVEGLPVEEFIRQNAGPLWLHANEMWEYMPADPDPAAEEKPPPHPVDGDDREIPF